MYVKPTARKSRRRVASSSMPTGTFGAKGLAAMAIAQWPIGPIVFSHGLNDRCWTVIYGLPLRPSGIRKALDQNPRAYNPLKGDIRNVYDERDFIARYHEHSRDQHDRHRDQAPHRENTRDHTRFVKQVVKENGADTEGQHEQPESKVHRFKRQTAQNPQIFWTASRRVLLAYAQERKRWNSADGTQRNLQHVAPQGNEGEYLAILAQGGEKKDA